MLDGLYEIGRPAAEWLGVRLLGGFRVAMADDSECVAIWAFPDWAAWVTYEQAWRPIGAMAGWRQSLIEAALASAAR